MFTKPQKGNFFHEKLTSIQIPNQKYEAKEFLLQGSNGEFLDENQGFRFNLSLAERFR